MVDLFGGAMTAAIPPTWRDVSQVRQVPDNQEVFQDCSEETGAVLIIEVLEHQIEVRNSDACAYFFEDLADDRSNEDASSFHIFESSHVVVSLHHNSNDHETNNNNERKKQTTWFPNLSIPASSPTDANTCCACISRGSQKVMMRGREGGGGGGGKQGPSASIHNNDDDPHRWITVEICVLRLPVVQTDLLITLSTPQQEQTCDTTVRSSCDASDQYGHFFLQILKTLNINDWSLFACG